MLGPKVGDAQDKQTVFPGWLGLSFLGQHFEGKCAMSWNAMYKDYFRNNSYSPGRQMLLALFGPELEVCGDFLSQVRTCFPLPLNFVRDQNRLSPHSYFQTVNL